MSENALSGPTGLAAIRALDYVVVLCDDVDALARFYAGTMGFVLRSHVPGKWAELQIGSTLLALRTRSRDYDGLPGDGA